MKAYSIFDDFGQEPAEKLQQAGVDLTVHPLGVPRPDSTQMKKIIEEYDCVIIGTSQKITEDMFEYVNEPRIIATASVGLDHIVIPDEKKRMVKIFNTPKANAQSVAEFTIGCALSCCKRLKEGNILYAQGKTNKALSHKPEDLSGKTIGVVGAGNIAVRIMEFADFLGMEILCWTDHPEKHQNLLQKGVKFKGLDELVTEADVISVNLPNNDGTRDIISSELVKKMKQDAIFISVSRLATINADAILERAKGNPNFYVCLDIDVDEKIVNAMPHVPNVLITPHIGGGTVAARKRMFMEIAEQVANAACNMFITTSNIY